MKKIISNIEKNIEPEINLPKYADEMMMLYYRNFCVGMMMNYYTFKEILKENTEIEKETEKDGDKVVRELCEEFTCVINDFVSGNGDSEKNFNRLSEIRDKNIDIVNILTAYTDIFSVYEHVLNRVEYKFSEKSDEKKEEFSNITDEDITRSVMQYILSEKDNMVINGKIGMVVRELPVRMTKSRFFEYLSEGLKVYRGHEKKSLDDFIYMIKSSAAIDLPEDLDKNFNEIFDIYKKFLNTKYSELTKEEYDNLKNLLAYVVEYLEETVSVHMMLQENINDLYGLFLGNQYVLTQPKEYTDLKDVITLVDELCSDEEMDEIDERITDIFVSLEGTQESIGEKTLKYEYVLDMVNSDMRDVAESIMIATRYDVLAKMRDLSSGSMFVEFGKEYDLSEADDSYISKATDKLINCFSESFKGSEKLLNRTRMAVTLSTLPVFFNNISEIQDYIYEALSQCGDEAEKLACKELLLSLVNEY